MLEENKTIELKDEDTEKVTGGIEYEGVEYKYNISQTVITKDDWILRITGFHGWNYNLNCPAYNTVIIKLPDNYPKGGWKEGKDYVTFEKFIVGLANS